jgi:hypothetical protein
VTAKSGDQQDSLKTVADTSDVNAKENILAVAWDSLPVGSHAA